MKSFKTWDGLEIAYQEWGRENGEAAGGLPPVVLHHGFVANADANWLATGVVEALTAAGRKVIAPDARGHGRSEKPHHPDRYGEQRMARDLAVLIDTIEADEIDLVGYSMGAIVSLLFACSDKRVRRLVIGGVGSGVIECGGVDRRAVSNDAIIEALSAEDISGSKSRRPSPFAGWRMRSAPTVRRSPPRRVRSTGARSRSGGSPRPRSCSRETPTRWRSARRTLVDALPEARLELLSGNHIEVLGDERFKQSIVDFLA